MKSNYRKLKRVILLRVLAVTVLTVALGYGILTFLIDGIFQDRFADLVVRVFMKLGMDYGQAAAWYGRIFQMNKEVYVIGGFLLLFLIFFYLSIGRMTRYLNEISGVLENILEDEGEPIVLPTELAPMAETLTAIRARFMRRERQAAESEQKKNELVTYLAHDLKTPLTTVTAYLTMLDEHPQMSCEEPPGGADQRIL